MGDSLLKVCKVSCAGCICDLSVTVDVVCCSAEYLRLLRERERADGLKGDPETDAFLKASALSGKRHSVVTEYMLRLLGLDVCDLISNFRMLSD